MAGESIEGPYAVERAPSGDERVARGWRLTGPGLLADEWSLWIDGQASVSD